ncbi:MAG TPA: UDP-glucose 4-epimerase GalE [Caulobacteraceae bacterium]|jgi:UDP-glucose 4-epimerase
MSVLVTGGAGYIGSHMVLALIDRGERVVVLDDLSTSGRAITPAGVILVEGDVADQALLRRLLAEHGVTDVLHFAGSKVVPESVEDPLGYWRNNTAASRDLIEACVGAGVANFIFSSTAAVYGAAEAGLLPESAPTDPANPYGRSKLATEWILQDVSAATSLRHVSLRYFNVAGADPARRTGQRSPTATHLVKRACQAALGRLPFLGVFGDDYPTPDGTCVRDYIHVTDLVDAHALALDYLRGGGGSATFNCGYGHGSSVRDVIGAVEQAAGHKLPVRTLPRRPGDVATVVADASRIKAELGWTPRYDTLDQLVSHALAWESSLNSDG